MKHYAMEAVLNSALDVKDKLYQKRGSLLGISSSGVSKTLHLGTR
jgi:hypothetical protein